MQYKGLIRSIIVGLVLVGQSYYIYKLNAKIEQLELDTAEAVIELANRDSTLAKAILDLAKKQQQGYGT